MTANEKRAFTLIELLVTIAIIGILAALLLTAVSSVNAAHQSGLFRCAASGARRASGGRNHAGRFHHSGEEGRIAQSEDDPFRLALPHGSLRFRQRLDHSTPPATTRTGGRHAICFEKMLGRAISFDALMSLAYDVDVIRVVSPPDKPAGGFDLLMTTPDASKEKLQQEIARSFGYVAHTETRATDVLLLQLKQVGAPGLKPSQGGRGGRVSSSSSSSGGASVGVRSRKVAVQNQLISIFVKNLQAYFDKPLLDRTGMTGNLDFALDVALGSGGSESDAIMRALPAQLGLELVPSREPLELLVAQKAK